MEHAGRVRPGVVAIGDGNYTSEYRAFTLAERYNAIAASGLAAECTWQTAFATPLSRKPTRFATQISFPRGDCNVAYRSETEAWGSHRGAGRHSVRYRAQNGRAVV